MQTVTTPIEALQKLQAGNRRFVEGTRHVDPAEHPARVHSLVGGQYPFAIILGCADSRVPAEMVFDQDLGDLFVIRVAGNIATPTQIGSIEYAVGQLDVELVVVLGHSGCGAIAATIDVVQSSPEGLSPHLTAIIDEIRPAAEKCLANPSDGDIAHEVMRENVRRTSEVLRSSSELLNSRIESGDLRIVGAEYRLENGEVVFFDGLDLIESA